MTGVFPDDLSAGGKQAVYNSVDYLRNFYNISILYKESLPRSEESLNLLKNKWNNVFFKKYKRDYHSIALWLYVVEQILLKFFYRNKESCLKHSLRHKMVFSEDLITQINKIIYEQNIDVVLTEFYPSTELVYCLPDKVKKIFIQHEIRFVRNKQVLQNVGFSSKMLDFLYRKCKAEEVAAMNSYDAIFTLTDIDKEKLEQNGVFKPVFTSPASISSKVSEKPFVFAQNYISYLGGAGHGPNANGVRWFVDNIWPIVLQANPKIIFQIIGNWSESQRLQYKNIPNLEFKGIVENLEDVLPGSIMVIPLLVGSGMRMKALEGIANKCNIISTKVGIEGLPFANGIDCYIEDEPEKFALRIIELLNDPLSQQTMWEKSFEWYNRYYSKEALMKKRKNFIDNIIEL